MLLVLYQEHYFIKEVNYTNKLLEKFNEFKSISGYRFEYTLENGEVISYKLKQEDFAHLIGLHKLTDIPIINLFNDKNNKSVSARLINSRIKKEEYLTDSTIRQSRFFDKIKDRYEFFSRDNILSVSYTDVIINFDSKLAKSLLKANYILFEHKSDAYMNLCIAGKNHHNMYAESFFYTNSNRYINGQKIIKVKQVKIYDECDNLIFTDII